MANRSELLDARRSYNGTYFSRGTCVNIEFEPHWVLYTLGLIIIIMFYSARAKYGFEFNVAFLQVYNAI